MTELDTHFAVVGLDRVAYQADGNGPHTLLYSAGMWSHLDVLREDPSADRFFRRLARFSRLIRFDRRGCGLSDARPNDGLSLYEHWQQDLLAVLDATSTVKAVFMITADGGPLLLDFACQHPERVAGLIFLNTSACFQRAEGYPQGHSPELVLQTTQMLANTWGKEDFCLMWNPSLAANSTTLRWYAKFQRAMASPRVVVENLGLTQSSDARAALPQITAPTLVLARSDFMVFPTSHSKVIAEGIAGARYLEFAGADADPFWQSTNEILLAIEEFVTGQRPVANAQRQLATVLFTDIVDSTRRAAKLGDAAWRSVLDVHDQVIKEQISAHEGRLVDSVGDGTLASFSTPGGAIDCAHALIVALEKHDIQIRAGLHIGEIELREQGRVGGMAVHIGARVLGEAAKGEVLASRTVRDVLLGSHYRFKERGIHELKGVPSKWPLYAVEAAK